MPTVASGECFGGVTYHIGGELVPVLSIDVSSRAVYFEHHILLWKHANVQIGIRAVKGAAKRMLAGMQVFITEASGDGIIAFSRDGVGQVVPIHLVEGEELHVREHQFLAATANIEYTYQRIRGLANMLVGRSGLFVDKFRGHGEQGVLWLHGYGNVFEKRLAPGETIDIEPGSWLYKDAQVKMETVADKLKSGWFGGGFNFIVNRFTGPGRVGIQSMYVSHATEKRSRRARFGRVAN
jgi:uncharacterized protein (AIM24 family)